MQHSVEAQAGHHNALFVVFRIRLVIVFWLEENFKHIHLGGDLQKMKNTSDNPETHTDTHV